MEIQCYKCQKEFEIDETLTIGRSEECPFCGAFIRCCKMCLFYDEQSYNECREPSAQRITEKEKGNFCNHFRISDRRQSQGPDKQKIFDAANALFKD